MVASERRSSASQLSTRASARYARRIATTGDRAGQGGDDGRGAGVAALACGDEDHVSPLEDFLDLLMVLFGAFAGELGVGPGAEATGELAADVELDVRVGHQQGLGAMPRSLS